MQALHVQQRCAPPPFNIDCSVGVGMCGVATTDAFEARLALAAFRVDHTARRAGLRRVLSRNSYYLTSILFHFVCQGRRELMPAGIEDGPVQSGLLTDVLPGGFDSALTRRCHSCDFEIFNRGNAKSSCDTDRGPLMKITSNASLLSLKTSDTGLCSAPAIGTLLAPRENALCLPLLRVQTSKSIGHCHHFASRQSESRRHATINTDHVIAWSRRVAIDLAGEAQVPLPIMQGYGWVHYAPPSWLRISELNPTYFGDADQAPLRIEFTESDVFADEAEVLLLALLPVSRVASASEKRSKRSVEIARDAMKTVARNSSDPVKLSTKSRDLRALGSKAERSTSVVSELPPPSIALLKAKIINKTAYTGSMHECLPLLVCRGKPICAAANDHVGDTMRQIPLLLKECNRVLPPFLDQNRGEPDQGGANTEAGR